MYSGVKYTGCHDCGVPATQQVDWDRREVQILIANRCITAAAAVVRRERNNRLRALVATNAMLYARGEPCPFRDQFDAIAAVIDQQELAAYANQRKAYEAKATAARQGTQQLRSVGEQQSSGRTARIGPAKPAQ